MSYLYLHPGKEQSVRDYLDANWETDFTVITRDQALSAGLFGPGFLPF